MIEVTGKGGISAKVIADSVSSVNGKRITTFELVYPRFVHAEFLTHRLFSRNAASSRAIPIKKVIEHVRDNPAMPVHWGKNQPGMQASEEVNTYHKNLCKNTWMGSMFAAIEHAEHLHKSYDAHKQVVNRLLEPYQFIKVVCTATELGNFFWLRSHEDAQPEIRELSDCMYKAREESVPFELSPGEWHLPYIVTEREDDGSVSYQMQSVGDGVVGTQYLTLEEALKVSASCCAQVSYRLLDQSLEKAEKIYKALVESTPVHASPFEHQATPIEYDEEYKFDKRFYEWPKGVTHQDTNGDLWSGNLQGWIQHRQLIPDNVKW